jgi:hypothetical protein
MKSLRLTPRKAARLLGMTLKEYQALLAKCGAKSYWRAIVLERKR